jgi:hypothetical protein
MKKIILSAAVASCVLFASCEKERDCKCTTTTAFAGSSSTTTSTVTYKDVTKKQGKTLCASWTSTNDNGTVTTKDCELK